MPMRREEPVARRRRFTTISLGVFASLVVATVTGLGVAGAGEEDLAAEPPAPRLNDPAWRQSREEMEAQQRAEEARRRSPEARADRAKSRTAYRGLDRAQALQVAREKHADLVLGEVHRGLRLRKGERLVRFKDDFTAQIAHEGARGGAIVESTLPMRVEGDGGAPELADHRMVDRDAWFEPAAPIAAARFPKELAAGIHLDDVGVAVHPVGAANQSATRVEDKLFYPNVAVDTDLFAQSIPGGAETFLQLRSVDSPETHRLRFDLPPGARLRLLDLAPGGAPSPDAVEVVRGAERLVLVMAPLAWDSDHQSVPVEFDVAGNVLEMRVEHADRDVAYPVVVDPVFTEDQRYWHELMEPNWEIKDKQGWWYWEAYDPYATTDYYAHESTPGWPYGGLWVVMNNTANVGSVGQWGYAAPGDTYVFRFETYTTHSSMYTDLYQGIYNFTGPNAWNWEWTYNYNQYAQPDNWPEPDRTRTRPWRYWWNYDHWYRTLCAGTNPCSPYNADGSPASSAGNGAYVGLEKNAGPQGSPWIWVMGAQVAIEDNRAPTASIVSQTANTGWTEGTSGTVTVGAGDSGFGVEFVEVLRRGPGAQQSLGRNTVGGCAEGRRPQHCDPNVTTSFNYSSAGAPDGVNTYSAQSEDYVGNLSSFADWQLKIDTQPPTVPTPGGTLHDATRGADGVADGTSYTVIVNASDAGSGVKTVDYRLKSVASGQIVASGTRSNPSCDPTNGCSQQWSPSFDLDASNLDGEYAVEATVTDQLNHPRTAELHRATIDHAPPTITGVAHSPAGVLDGWHNGTQPIVSTVSAADSAAGVRTFELTYPDASKETRAKDCGTWDRRCAPTGSEPFSYSTSPTRFPSEGNAQVRAIVRDGVTDIGGRESQPTTWNVKIDRTKPTQTLTGGLRSLSPTGRDLHVHATDGDAVNLRSGMGTIALYIDLDRNGTVDTVNERVGYQSQTCTPGSCAMDLDYTLPANFADGSYTAKAVSTDLAGNSTEETWTFYVVSLLPGSRARLGLEDFFDYDSLEAGGDSRVHVNAETGNAVWHSVPIVNPGRGLSTFVNLTYNSQDRGGLLGSNLGHVPLVDAGGADLSQDLPGLSYGEAGAGFSISVSGPTRVNEPLGGAELAEKKEALNDQTAFLNYLRSDLGLQVPDDTPLGDSITLTDSDGTVHTFQRGQGNNWIHPAGVTMYLRRYNPAVASRVTIVPDKWAMTRPDGVTHFFDNLGYLTSTKDRNGNTLRYDYQHVNVLDGAECPAGTPIGDLVTQGSAELFCVRRLYRVVDPAGVDAGASPPASSTLSIAYRSGGLLSTGQLPFDSPLPFPGLVGGRAGRIDTITDHAGRTYKFDYDADGFLARFTEAADAPATAGASRVTRFDYEAKSEGSPTTTLDDGLGQDRQLVNVVEVRSNVDYASTPVEYQTRSESPPAPGVFRQPRRVGKLTSRSGFDRAYTYTSNADATRDMRVVATLKNAGAEPAVTASTIHQVDGQGRPVSTIDALGQQTKLAWTSDHRVAKLTEAVGTGDEAVTDFAYTPNGLLDTRSTYPKPSEARTIDLDYRDSAGIYRSAVVDDANGAFVSDLKDLKNPRTDRNTNWRFDYPDDRGNPTQRTDGAGKSTTTAYDATGQITSETDEVGNVTTYGDFHATGQPQSVVDPKGNKYDPPPKLRWIYHYDAAGNVTEVTDPRGDDGTALGAPHTRYTTTLTYDPFDRVTSEKVPKDSGASTPDFIVRSRTYDRNGNVLASVDGEDKTTTITHTKMDQPATVSAPAAGTTTYEYDGADQLVKRLDPVTTSAPASSTEFVLDALGQRTAEVRHAQGLTDLVTSFDYDERGNLVGLEDPNRNQARTVAAAVTAASSTARRLSYAYDDVDELTSKVERPTPAEITAGVELATTQYEYDLNGNQVKVLHPRSFDTIADGNTGPIATAYTYDHRDQPIKITDPEGKSRSYTRREDGKVIADTSARGEGLATEPFTDPETGRTYQLPKYFSTRYTYDPQGEVIQRTVPYAPGQYELPDATLKNWKAEYRRDRVGNPHTIVDPRGNAIANTFYDTGHLRSTSRPAAYELDWGNEEDGGGPYDAPGQGERFGVQRDDVDTRISDGGPQLVERTGRSTNAERSEEAPELPSSDGQGNFGAVDRERLDDLLPRAGATSFAYDDEMRLKDISGRTIAYDDAGRVSQKSWPFKDTERIDHTYTYDTHGNLASFTDGKGYSTTFTYDGFDRRAREEAPGADTTDPGAAGAETTTYGYDENGNVLTRGTPRAGFSFQYGYDTLDRLTSEANPAGDKWTYAYNVAGSRVMERAPEGATRTGSDQTRFETSTTYDLADRVKTATQAPGSLDLTTTYSYDPDGNRTKIEAPGAKAAPGGTVEPRVTELTYDGRDMPWKYVAGTGASRRTTLRTFDANGNLRRIRNPDGQGDSQASDDGTLTAANLKDATRHARLHVYDADDLLTFVYLPWGDQVPNVSSDLTAPARVDDKRYVQRFDRDARGRVASIFAPYEIGASAAPQTTYSYFENDWILGMSDEEMRQPTPPNPPITDHLVTYDYDKQGNQTKWKTRNATTSKGRIVTREFWPNGLLRSRTGRKVNDDGGEDQTTTRTYRHGYNANRSLIWMKDERKAGDANDDHVTTFSRDGAERESIVNETWADGKDTRLTYDSNGNPLTRQTDGRWTGSAYQDSDSGRNDAKTTTFAYDSVDRETSMVVRQGDDPARTTTKTYHPSGELASSTRDMANDIVEERYFNVFGDPSAMRRKRADASDWNLKDQTYSYDDNGNRTQDERGTHEVNARDQLVKWTRGSKQPKPGTTVTYELTGSGAIAKKLDKAEDAIRQLTTFTFDGTRLAKSETNESESTYSYDDLGSVVRIRTAPKVGGTVPPPTPELPSLPAQCTPLATVENEVRYCYDEFERMLVAKGSGVGKDAAVYEYDGFDRRDRMTVKKLTGDEPRDLSYVGSARLLSRERDASGNTKYYDYDSSGVRVGQARAPTSTPDPSTFRGYGHDANGSVEELQEADGSVATGNRYVYDPYGALDTRGGLVPDDPEEHLSADAKDNPFRFQGLLLRLGRQGLRHAGPPLPPRRRPLHQPGPLRVSPRRLQPPIRPAHAEPLRVRRRQPRQQRRIRRTFPLCGGIEWLSSRERVRRHGPRSPEAEDPRWRGRRAGSRTWRPGRVAFRRRRPGRGSPEDSAAAAACRYEGWLRSLRARLFCGRRPWQSGQQRGSGGWIGGRCGC